VFWLLVAAFTYFLPALEIPNPPSIFRGTNASASTR
jgi:hypothetical protein